MLISNIKIVKWVNSLFSILAFGPSLGRKDISTIFRHFNFFFSEQLDEFMFLGPQAPLGTPFVRPLVSPRQKSKSPLKPYKSFQDHMPDPSYVWNIAGKSTMSSIIQWWQRQRQISQISHSEQSTGQPDQTRTEQTSILRT